MGGRGSSFGVEIISAVSSHGYQGAEIQELNVAGMTPMDRGSRFTNAEKTLDYLETKKLEETIQENSDWAWEQAQRERAEMEKKQKTQGGTDGKKDEV